MATTKPAVPPGNLKDRIAALQQRSVSPTNPATAEPSPYAPVAAGGGRVSSLKDKIANFERKGAVPTPRGRFDAAALPVGDGSTKKKGELYGNRVPELAKPTDAALLTRKRTVSTSSASARSASPEEVPPVPALAGLSAPTSGLPAARRVVSDIGPRTDSITNAERSPLEEKKLIAGVADAPAQPEDLTAGKLAGVAPEGSKAGETPKSEPANDVPQPAIVDNKSSPLTPPQVVEKPAATRPRQNSSAAPEVVSTSTESLIVNTELDNSSVLGDTTASSESVPTPSTGASFTTPAPTADDAKRSFVRDPPQAPTVMPATPETASPISVSAPRNSVAVRQSVISEMSVGSALEAKIVSEPPKLVSPTITRATIVPASTLSSASPPPPVTTTETATPERRTTQRSSFHATVHRKVRETSISEPAPSMPASSPAPPKPTYPPPSTPATPRARATVPAEPTSPSLSDLASLMADAALLEEALSTPTAKRQAPVPAPTVNVQPAIPEVPEPTSGPPSLPQNVFHTQPDVIVATPQPQSPPPSYTPITPDISYFAGRSLQQPSVHVRSQTTSVPESSPPQKEVHRFSSLRERKQSIPQSVYSEAESAESSVFVAMPSSPRSHFRDNDASSVKSSSKSLKGSKKGFGRASSWFFKGKNKSNSTIDEQGVHQGASEPSSPLLLMPHPPVPPLPTQIYERPVSVASGASGDVFDLDSFPSVPGGAAATRPHSMLYPNTAESASQQQGHGQARPHTMYAPARKQ